MRRKWKIGLVLACVAIAIGTYWLWPSLQPTYEGKRLGQWLDEGMELAPDPYVTNPSVARVVKAIQAIGTNAIPFLLRDFERKQPPSWLEMAKWRVAYKLKLIEKSHLWTWRVNRAVWGFKALGTNAAPALGKLLAIYDGGGILVGSAGESLSALGPFAVPELEKRLHATDLRTKWLAASCLGLIGPAAEAAIPSLVAMLDDTNSRVHLFAVQALAFINRQPERLVPLFGRLLGDSNYEVRIYAAEGLKRFGLSAKEAVPDLLRAANDSNPNVSDLVRQTLEQIESESSKAASR